MPMCITYSINSNQYIMVGKAKISIQRLPGGSNIRVTIDAPQDVRIKNVTDKYITTLKEQTDGC